MLHQIVVVQTDDIPGLRSRFRRGSLSCERGALDLRVEQDVERFSGLPVRSVVGQVERDHADVVGLEQLLALVAEAVAFGGVGVALVPH